jgi:hypothetical protein
LHVLVHISHQAERTTPKRLDGGVACIERDILLDAAIAGTVAGPEVLQAVVADFIDA